MPLDELPIGITDHVDAQLVECAPPQDPPESVRPADPEASPTAQALEATIEQTGSGPPPKG
jgi:hypothetical protein